MTTFFAALTAFFCADPVVVNLTQVWNKIDQLSLDTAKEHCVEHFPQSPCLSTFTKRAQNTYHATCKGEVK